MATKNPAFDQHQESHYTKAEAQEAASRIRSEGGYKVTIRHTGSGLAGMWLLSWRTRVGADVGRSARGYGASGIRGGSRRIANRKNPTKAQKREKAAKSAAKRRVAVALAKYLKQQNPAAKLAGAKVEKLKGGVLKITPIKANAGGSKWKAPKMGWIVESRALRVHRRP